MKKIVPLFLLLTCMVFSSCEDDENDVNEIATVTFTLDDLVEVESATQAIAVNIGISTPYHAGGTIDVSISGAAYGVDYNTSTGGSSFSLDVQPNALLATFSIEPIDNDVLQDKKVLTVTITGVSGSFEMGEESSFTLTILDDEEPLVAAVGFESQEAVEISENATQSTQVNLAFDQPSTAGGTIQVSATGDAAYGTDYNVTGADNSDFEITVEPGASSASFEVQAMDNDIFDADKSIAFTITGVSGGLTVGEPKEVMVTIVNDDVPPSPVVDFATATSSYDEDAGTITIDFELSGTTSSDAVIEVTASGTAVMDEDYALVPTGGNPYAVVVPAGTAAASLTLDIIDDTQTEEDETILLNIVNVTGGLDTGVNQQEHTVTINANDAVAPYEYVETFEDGATLVDKGYQQVLITQDLPVNQVPDTHNKDGEYADVDDVTATSNWGVQMFYKTDRDGEGTIDNAIITPFNDVTGEVQVSYDVSYITGLAKNTAVVTLYYSETYDGNGNWNDGDWTALETVTAADIDAEGVARKAYSRRNASFMASQGFYIAIRINQVVNAENDAVQWRYDNIKVNNNQD
ncbi:MAG: hypothetical protein CL868_16580 [Cytophagaceae bacterium]|nr:hypothetical protein [Cytophagaceae bacterium]|tara:strand:- start:6757 stop:8487 length:1731 start_codon:yes stop_codon:yes gene_type:complete